MIGCGGSTLAPPGMNLLCKDLSHAEAYRQIVRKLAYLALLENDQSSVKSRICEVRYVCIHTWRAFYSCFLQGAWSCLEQNMDLEGTPLFFCPRGVVGPVW